MLLTRTMSSAAHGGLAFGGAGLAPYPYTAKLESVSVADSSYKTLDRL
jgi:hypothetical protein